MISNKGIGTFVLGIFVVLAAVSFSLTSQNAISQQDLIADDMYLNLLENEAGLTGGYAIYEFKSPSNSDLFVDESSFKIRMLHVEGSTPLSSLKQYVEEITTEKVKIIDYTEVCQDLPNKTAQVCAIEESGFHYDYVSKSNWKELTSYTFKPNQVYKIKIEAKWPLKRGFNSREWFPQIVYNGKMYEQSKWAWWNVSFDYRTLWAINNTGSVDLVLAVNDNDGLNSHVYWVNASEGVYAYHTTEDFTGDISFGTDSDGINWENDSDRSGIGEKDVWNQSSYLSVWHMNDDSGTVYDSTSASVDLTITGGSETTGLFGNGIDLDGTNDYLGFGSNHDFGSGAWSVSIWIHPHDPASCGVGAHDPQNLIGASPETTVPLSYFSCGGGSAQKLCFYEGGWNCGSDNIAQNQWQLAVLTHDGSGEYKSYLDDRSQSTKTGGSAGNLVFHDFGRRTAGNHRYFDGVIDEARVHNKELSLEEVQAIYYNGITNYTYMDFDSEEETLPNCPEATGDGLVAHWELDETSGTTASDSSGHGRNGTLTNFDFDGSSISDCPIGSCLRFDGVNDFVNFTDIPRLNINTGEFTIAFWINTTHEIGATMDVLSSEELGTAQTSQIYVETPSFEDDMGLVMTHLSNGTAALTVDEDSQGYQVYYDHAYMNMTNNDFNFVAFIADSEKGRLFTRDGYMFTIDDIDVGVTAPLYNYTIGDLVAMGVSTDWTSNWYEGDIDDFRVYNRSLSFLEIAKLYERGSGECQL